MATLLETENVIASDYFHQALPNYYRLFLKKFRKIAMRSVHFNLMFILLFSIEIVSFAVYFPSMYSNETIALFLCTIFVTSFAYLVTYFYLSSRKPEQMTQLRQEFISSCRSLLDSPKGIAHHHLTVAETLTRLSGYLTDFEWEIYKVPALYHFLSPIIRRFAAAFYWNDVFKMKQMLLLSAIQEHIKQIHLTATDLEVHASLGSTYVTLSKLYRKPTSKQNHPKTSQIEKIQQRLEQKSDFYCKLAIEEFKILSHYAADDPWVHEQMAAGYKALDMVEEEIQEVETLLKLRPQDKETLFHLGSLYFSVGKNAKGLQIYQELKTTNYKKAEDLIANYGSA